MEFNATYYNLSRLSSLADYTENSEYEFVRLHKVSIELVRASDETATFNQLHGSSVFLAYYPILKGVTMPYNIVSRDATAYKIDLMTFDKQTLSLPIENILYQNTTTGATFNNSAIMPYGNVVNIDG